VRQQRVRGRLRAWNPANVMTGALVAHADRTPAQPNTDILWKTPLRRAYVVLRLKLQMPAWILLCQLC